MKTAKSVKTAKRNTTTSTRTAKAKKPVDPKATKVDLSNEDFGSYEMALTSMPPEYSWPGLDRQLVVKRGELFLSRSAMDDSGYWLTPCTFQQAVQWCKAIRSVYPQRGDAEHLLLKYACRRQLVYFTDDELKALKQAAAVNHRGDVGEFVRAWMKESCRAEIESGKVNS